MLDDYSFGPSRVEPLWCDDHSWLKGKTHPADAIIKFGAGMNLRLEIRAHFQRVLSLGFCLLSLRTLNLVCLNNSLG